MPRNQSWFSLSGFGSQVNLEWTGNLLARTNTVLPKRLVNRLTVKTDILY